MDSRDKPGYDEEEGTPPMHANAPIRTLEEGPGGERFQECIQRGIVSGSHPVVVENNEVFQLRNQLDTVSYFVFVMRLCNA